jgi:hypothetical protein
MSEHYTDQVKEAIYCFEQCTSEKYEEDLHKAARYESCIYELFKLMTDDELDCYRAKLVELGYVDKNVYDQAERFVTAQK